MIRLTSDVERLPFPMAPVGAQGVVAIAEQVEGSVRSAGSSVRWRVFCIGAAIGMVFGVIYMALPTLTGAFLDAPVMVLPIPFADFTPYTQRLLPAVATGLSFDLGQLILGMVFPFFAVLGSFVALVATFVANPILHGSGLLPTWKQGDETVVTLFSNNVDFYFSFAIGISLAIAGYGVLTIIRSLRQRKLAKALEGPDRRERGDIPSRVTFFTYLVSVVLYIVVSGFLIEWDRGVMIVLVFFGVLYTPLISYVTAKLEGLAGQVIEIPFVMELAFILSGYKGVAVWFLPVPKANYGVQTVFYKQAELLGCKFTSVWKSTIILFPIIFISLICFSSFIWSMAEIPSAGYPYTMKMWEFEAKNACLVYSATLGEYSVFQEALNGRRVLTGLGVGSLSLLLLGFFGAPTMFFFGMVRGLGQVLPHTIIPNFVGALIGRYYFQKKYGREWRKMIPVVAAGFFVGGGLMSVLAIGLVFLAKAVSTTAY
jgi:hypothetical protein